MSVHWTYQIPAVATRLFLADDVVQVSGRNCVFGVRSNVHFNDTLVIAVMSGTAMFALPLPPPSYTMPAIVSPFTQARDPALTMLKEQIVDMVKVNASELQSEIVVPRRRARSATMTRGDTDDMSDGSSTTSSMYVSSAQRCFLRLCPFRGDCLATSAEVVWLCGVAWNCRSDDDDDLKIDDEPTRKPWLLGIDDGDYDELSIVLNDLRPPPVCYSSLLVIRIPVVTTACSNRAFHSRRCNAREVESTTSTKACRW
jgi:hypothetical protein